MLSEWWQDKEKNIYLTPEEAKSAPTKTTQTVGKMSKSLRNYRAPQEIFDQYGADALRWYFFAKQPPWTSIQYSERQIKESIPEFLLRLWNVYNGFFIQYANLDGFSPASLTNPGQLAADNFSDGHGYRPVDQRSELDRWILSELHRTLSVVIESMDQYDNYRACTEVTAFVDALSNWYVRRSRDRFWSKDKSAPEKLDAYWTLYECLTTTAKMVAPFVPFMAETIWQNLSSVFEGRATESVHLCDFPTPDPMMIDADLSRRMGLLREIASSGLSARMNAQLKVRQPLSGVTVVLNEPLDQAWLETHGELLKTELNVDQVTYTTDAGEFVTYQVVPNFKRLGPRVGKLMPKLKAAFQEADGAAMLAELTQTNQSSLTIEGQLIPLDQDDVEVRLQANEGWAASQGPQAVIVLATELTPELIRSGLARDVNRLVQDRRKELDLERSDSIELNLVTESDDLKQAILENSDYLMGETLATRLGHQEPSGALAVKECNVGDGKLQIFIKVTGEVDA
jgi:isoleucyl-tRNA synthetase